MSITDELRKYAQWQECKQKVLHLNITIDELHANIEHLEGEPFCIELPVDADGVPIRIGDVIAYKDNTKPKEVVALVPPSVVMVEDGPRYADMCRHYHAPTVEDVLLDACNAYHSLMVESMSDIAHDMPAPSEIIAEYAAKLRLADDGEEQ